ncbi:MAG: transposase [Spirochaetaceae bacterium]|jgi:hypothetical protein|nr:transposase [Spirochaetaceae bacterium]
MEQRCFLLSGNVTGECRGAHKAEDYPVFLKKADKESGKGKTLPIIADNYATHKTKEVRAYFETKGGCFVTHFIPARSSWLN